MEKISIILSKFAKKIKIIFKRIKFSPKVMIKPVKSLAKIVKSFPKMLMGVTKLLMTPKAVIVAGIIVALVIGVAILMFGIGKGWGNGAGDEKGDGNTNITTVQESTVEVHTSQTEIETTKQTEEATICVNVVGNEYFYNNIRISLEELIDEILGIEGELVVEVTDDNASLKAYNGLLDCLEEQRIKCKEKRE